MGTTFYTFNGGGTAGNWSDATIWTTDPTGSTSINAKVPGINDNAVVTNSFVVSLTADVTESGLSVTIQRGGVLDLKLNTSTSNPFKFTSTLNSLSGQGILRVSGAYFPAVTTNNFDDANTGTVEFYNWPTTPATLPIPTSGFYNNLRLLNTTATDYVAQIDNTLTLNGNLTLTRTSTAAVSLNLGQMASINRTLNVLGNVTVGTGTFLGATAASGSHTLNASGSFVNNGTVNFWVSTTQNALLNFTSNADANFACNGPTVLGIMQVDKGFDSQTLLNVTGAPGPTLQGYLSLNSTAAGDILILKNGITKLGNNIYLSRIHNGLPSPSNLTNSAGWFQIGSATTSPTLWIAGATVIADATEPATAPQFPNASLIAVYGILRVSGGRLTCVNDGGLVIREDAQILIDGKATVTVNKFRPSSTATTHRGSFTMTDGTFKVTGQFLQSSFDDNYARFAMPFSTQAFRMSGGTIEVSNPNTGDGFLHIGVNANNASVTGGTIKLYLPTGSNTNNCQILTTTPLWNLDISRPGATNTSKAILSSILGPNIAGMTTAAQPLTVLNNFTIGGTNTVTFDAANLDVNIQGTLSIGSNGTYLPGTNTTTFSGSQNQVLNNSGLIGATASTGTFNNWTVNKSAGTLTLAGSINTYSTPASATLAILNGVLNDAGKTINVQGSLINSAFHQSVGTGSITLVGTGTATPQTIGGDGTGVFGNLTIDVPTSPIAIGSVAVSLTANTTVSNVLTLNSLHVLAVGAYRLSLTNISPNAIEPSGAFSTSRMVQTAGNASDLGLQKTYGPGTSQSFTFPVGVGTKFTPAKIDITSIGGLDKFGQVSVSPANMRNPFATGSNNALKYFWKVRKVNFGSIPAGSIDLRFTMINTDAVGPTTNYVGGRYLPTAWMATTKKITALDATTSRIDFIGLDDFGGEFTTGDNTTVPTAFGTVTAFYSIANGNWNANTTWSTVSNTGAAVPAGSTVGTNFPGPGNPVFIGLANTIPAAASINHTVTVIANNAQAGSLVIDRNSTLDVASTTGHNFGELPDSKVGGSGRLRISSTVSPAVFPGGDFGSFIQYGGGTVEYYTSGTSFTLPTIVGSLTLNQYRNLWLNAASGQTITLPAQDLRIYSQLRTGVPNGATTFPGTALISSAAAGNLRVDSLVNVTAGTFRLQGTTARTLTMDTDVRVDASATFDVTNNAGIAHALTVGRSFINNGALDFNVGTGKANLTFIGSADTKLTGTTGTKTNLSALTVNKGIGRTATLTLDVAGAFTTPTFNWLTLTNGTLNFAKANGTLTIHDQASSYLIADNAGLTVNASGATATVATATSAASDLKLAGTVQVLQGTLNVGTAAGTGNDLEYASAGTPTLKVSSTGTLYVNGQLRRTVNNLDGSLRYDQTGGTVNIDGQGATAASSNERGLFEVQGVGSIFRMSAGTLNLHRSNQKNPIITADLYLAPDSTVVTGGTVVLGNPTTASIGSSVAISVNSTVPLYDLKVESGATSNTNTGLLTGVVPLTLKGSLTIGNDFSFFKANGLGLTINQHLVNNNTSASTALNVGGFQPITTTQTTTFVGSQTTPTQLLTGTASNLTVFGSLVVNNPQPSGTLQLGGNARVAGTLTLAKGTLDDNGKTLTALGDVLNSATHTSTGTGSIILAGTANQNLGGNGTGSFGNLTLNNSSGATTIANQEITKVLALTSGVFTIGSNLLLLSNTAATAVTGFDATRFIRTNGIVADLGVRKNYPTGASNFTFPVGAAAKYTPVQMNLTSNSAVGTITVQPIDLAHPSTTDPAAKELSFYWKVSSTGFSAPVLTQQFTYVDNGVGNDVNGTEANYKLGRFLNGSWTPVNGITTSAVSAAANTLTNTGVAYIDGDYTGAETSEFGAVSTFYSRNATAGPAAGADWNLASSWTYNSDGSDAPLPLPTTFPTLANPVVIRAGHLIKSAGPSRGAATLQLLGTLDLGINAANNFSTVSGTGTLRIGSALFPAGNYVNFVAPNTGTVDFTGAVQLPARDTYNNLSLSGGATAPKQLTNQDLIINGTLNVAASTTVDNPTSQAITLTSATSGVTINGTFNLNDGNLTTGAAVATGSGSALNLGAGTVAIGTSLTNGGTTKQGTGLVTVGTSLTNTNTGTYNATTGTGNIAVGTTFTNNGTYTAGVGNLDVTGNVTNTTTGNFTAGTGEVNAGSNFSNAGSYTAMTNNIMHVDGDFSNLATGIFDAANSNMVLRGSFTNSNGLNFNANTSLVQFITNLNRFITGNTTFFTLQKLGSSALTLGASTDVRVSDILTIQNSIIYTGANSGNTLYLDKTDTQPIIGNSLTAYVSGRLAMKLPDAANSIREFPVGAGGRYRPVTIKPLAASTNAVVLVEIINGASPGANNVGNFDPSTLQNTATTRYYRIQLLPGGTLNQPTIQLSFNTDVEDEKVNVPGNLRVARSTGNAGQWKSTGGSGVYSPDAPKGYTTSAATIIDATSFFVLASTNQVDNPLSGSSPLPVELLQFTATRQGSAVSLAWATASEKNSAYFQVQRSADGRTFTDLNRVAAQGTSTRRHDYFSLDTAPLAGMNYYRLRQVDNDGTAAYSPIAVVRFEGKSATPALVAYPNPAPAQGFQLLAINLGTTGGTVKVYDNVGRLVLTQVATTGEVETTIKPVRPLASGMYFVTWQADNGVKLTTKVVVE